MPDWKRWKGLAHLVRDGVVEGSKALEKVHLDTSDTVYRIVGSLPPLAPPARLVRAVHHTVVQVNHGAVRGVTHAVAAGVDLVLPDEPVAKALPDGEE